MNRQIMLVVLTLCLFLGCEYGDPGSATKRKPEGASATPQVFVTNYPLKYFTRRIGRDRVDVEFPMTSEGDPAFWKPDSQTIARFQNADLILINGATYEKWLISATLPEEKIVDTSAGFRNEFIQIQGAITHSHGPEGMHSHAGTVFTTWIDFDQAAQQATAIRDALAKLMPDAAPELDKNLQFLLDDLKQLDQEMLDVSHTIGDRPLIASHPIYQYFARRYSLNIKAVLWEPDVVPTDEAIAELKKILENHPAQVLIWEGTPDPASVEKLKAIGLASVVFDPCANVCSAGDWLAVMQANVNGLRSWAESSK